MQDLYRKMVGGACFTDNKIEEKSINVDGSNYEVINPQDICKYVFDRIIISNLSRKEVGSITEQLKNIGNSFDITILADDNELLQKVVCARNFYDEYTDKRVSWLREYSRYVANEKIQGNVAECGVLYGDFSYYINKYFPDRTLYLFDTFMGFDQKDIEEELKIGDVSFSEGRFSSSDTFGNNSIEIVKKKMNDLSKCIFRQGYFPESAMGIEDTFAFVNLDMDLYKPTLEGLHFFYDRMSRGGVLLVHDYFTKDLSGVKVAIREFCSSSNDIHMTTIGDGQSIAIIK